ncbi:hypothetical protein F0310_05630 (plasmid) [Borrelia sp. A-FGy1]|uniref:hypothetical protein n=1 Tax=Borrelia sp. A-FGy1 TaxID=2608247 RepID=UPI0015F741E5|nr:hypothetical protein [Borrelia sp. A-FGy1]QMU99888.1 hypothetical protein F0310_05630 [Borrelia sp. A-FGy1]
MRLCLIKIFIIPNLVFNSLFLFDSCSGFLSKKSIEQLALKDHQENKNTTNNTTNTSVDKNSKENESPKYVTSSNIKISDTILQKDSNQHMSDDTSANKEFLQNSSTAVIQNESPAQPNAKAEEIKSPTAQHEPLKQNNLKNSLTTTTTTSKTPAIPSEDQIKANLDAFAEEEHEKASLEAIKNADLIMDPSKNNLDKNINDVKKDYERLSDYFDSFHSLLKDLNKTPQSRKHLIKEMQRIRPILQQKLEEMHKHIQNADNYWQSAKSILDEAKDKLAESIHKRLLLKTYRVRFLNNRYDKEHTKRLSQVALDYANSCIQNTENAVNSLQYGNNCKKEIEKYM